MSGIALPIDAVAGAPQFPAAQNRVADAALMQGRTDRSLGAVSGFRPGSDPGITITAARVWTATPANGIIDPGTGPAVGPYRFAFFANETGTLDAADPNYTRYDRIDVQVPDDPPGGSPLAAIYVVTKGVAQAAPTVPAAPARSFPVGVFTVPNAGNPSFAATYPYCGSSGSIVPTRSGYRPANPYLGQYIDDAVLGLMRYNGSDWAKVGIGVFAAGSRPASPYVGQYIDDAQLGLLRYNGTAWVPAALTYYEEAQVNTFNILNGWQAVKTGATTVRGSFASCFNTTTGVLTPPVTGVYHLGFGGGMGASASAVGRVIGRISDAINGGGTLIANDEADTTSGTYAGVSPSTEKLLTAGVPIYFSMFGSSGVVGNSFQGATLFIDLVKPLP